MCVHVCVCMYVCACLHMCVYLSTIALILCRYRLRPRMLRDVSNINMKTTIMGDEVDFPVGAAPTAMQRMAHDDGELATARG